MIFVNHPTPKTDSHSPPRPLYGVAGVAGPDARRGLGALGPRRRAAGVERAGAWAR